MDQTSERAAQRRFWLLQRLLANMEAERALELAERMEAFVADDGEVSLRKEHHRHQEAENAPTRESPAQAGTIAHGLQSSSIAEPPASMSRRESAGRLLNDDELKAFMDRAIQGATNRDLARLFGLTPRQANGIRMALAKRTPQVALRPSPSLDVT